MTLVEVASALAILTTAMLAIVQLLAVVAGQRRTLEQRRVALQEVANRAEHVALLSWEETAAETLTTWRPTEELLKTIPQARCSVEIREETGTPAVRRIRLLVSWPNAAGNAVEPVGVSIWKFQAEASP